MAPVRGTRCRLDGPRRLNARMLRGEVGDGRHRLEAVVAPQVVHAGDVGDVVLVRVEQRQAARVEEAAECFFGFFL